MKFPSFFYTVSALNLILFAVTCPIYDLHGVEAVKVDADPVENADKNKKKLKVESKANSAIDGFSKKVVDPDILFLKAKPAEGKPKTVVLVSGDEEYRTEESMPMLAKILSQKHGFNCKVLFSWHKDGGYIDPDNHKGVKGWHHWILIL